MRRAIGAKLDAGALALLSGRAQRHRPHDRETLRAAAVELRGRGLLPRDIAETLGLAEAAVLALLGVRR